MSYLLKFFLFIAFAQGGGDNSPGGGNNTQSIRIENPLGEGATIMTLLERIINFLTYDIGPIIAVAMILVAAFQMMTASSNEEKFKTGRKTLTYTLIGYTILLLANGLIFIIKDILGAS